ncbi:flagellar associated protein [Monoraphidium neglectum]|uniref:Flagellar associated protein n=1 Tax=Monoraphidium neglectum TaxID=145388 RepID=A0A0D2JQW0_9CHLO|nr:flagellar associated protein [Monoraphidium neglectum]KIZ01503.1 flagellar associated protein [Monoraphidium neglectum]|eukprot:XP_013900522.1 flagellar associated protein [Monoraphidium neglectum]
MLAAKRAAPRPVHAPKSDAALFQAPAEVVHALLPDARPGQAIMTGIQSMLLNRAARHAAALRAHAAALEAARGRAAAGCEAAARRLAARMAGCDSEIEARLDTLHETRVMQLDSDQIEEVWEYVASHGPERLAWLGQLESDLAAAESERRGEGEAALRVLAGALQEASHVDEGQAQRLVEAEALALNAALLEDRQRACEALKRLHTSEVLQERARRRRWEAGLSQWRTLRSEHAIDSFAKRLASCEFTETEAALRLFGQLREAQQEAARKLLEHVRSAAPRMMPPGTSAAAAAAWGEEGERLCGEWDARLADGLGALEKQDSETEAQRAY